MQQRRIAILSNAGGSGKTTLATHLAYLLAREKKSVVLFDLDPQGSVNLFGGLSYPLPNKTLSSVFTRYEDFEGDWPIVPLWKKEIEGAYACQGEIGLEKSIKHILLSDRGAYLLADLLKDYPLKHNVLIFDCPATLGVLPTNAISAATHILIPIQLEPKSTGGASGLLKWLYEKFEGLRLEPTPEIIGVVPNQYEKNYAIHRNLLEQINPMLEKLNITCFQPIRFSTEFKNASAFSVPLHIYRPKHPACKDFEPILQAILLNINQEEKKWAVV